MKLEEAEKCTKLLQDALKERDEQIQDMSEMVKYKMHTHYHMTLHVTYFPKNSPYSVLILSSMFLHRYFISFISPQVPAPMLQNALSAKKKNEHR